MPVCSWYDKRWTVSDVFCSKICFSNSKYMESILITLNTFEDVLKDF